MTDYRTLPETSAAQGLDHCNGCGTCCRINPCLLVPADVRRIADRLGRSRRELAKDLQVERTPTGRWLVRMHRPCVFLDGNVCTIHDFKPTGARDFGCWRANPQTYYWSESDLRLVRFRVDEGEAP